MACPTCDHTMDNVCREDTPVASGQLVVTRRVYYCPRCGTMTILHDATGRVDTYVPKIVERCRKFEKEVVVGMFRPGEAPRDDWTQIGIAESINPPGKRPGEGGAS